MNKQEIKSSEDEDLKNLILQDVDYIIKNLTHLKNNMKKSKKNKIEKKEKIEK